MCCFSRRSGQALGVWRAVGVLSIHAELSLGLSLSGLLIIGCLFFFFLNNLGMINQHVILCLQADYRPIDSIQLIQGERTRTPRTGSLFTQQSLCNVDFHWTNDLVSGLNSSSHIRFWQFIKLNTQMFSICFSLKGAHRSPSHGATLGFRWQCLSLLAYNFEKKHSNSENWEICFFFFK